MHFRLGDVCTKIGSGATPRGGSSVYLDQGQIAFIRSQNIHNDGFRREGLVFLTDKHAAELSNVEVQERDVLLNITGDSVARSCEVDAEILPARVNQHVAIIRPDPKQLWPRFLRYCLIAPPMQANMLSLAGSGGTRNALTKGMIEAFQIDAPRDVGEQRDIANILSSLDEKIELNRRMNETLEAIARATFKSWFVDFDPVKAKAAGRRPAGMDAATAALFPVSFENSELGAIPEGWRAGTVAEEFNLTMGQSPPGESYNENGKGFPFYQGRTDYGFRYPLPRVYCNAPTRFANAGDTLVSVRAPVGDLNMASERCCIGRGVAAIRHKGGSRSYTYYAMHFLSDMFREFEAGGTVFGCMNKNDFACIKHAVPPLSLVERFEDVAFAIDQEIESKLNESRSLTALRDALLPKLISGELRIPDAVKRAKAAA